ncbi:MAG: methyltransferase domain-containing protein [Alphaproteobacteria bacterium]|nr:methyltransferase domain-containing protein [Rickettsiales bacterium]
MPDLEYSYNQSASLQYKSAQKLFSLANKNCPQDIFTNYSGFNVLDIGCGTGFLLDTAINAQLPISQFVGIDKSQKMVNFCKQKFAHLPDNYFNTSPICQSNNVNIFFKQADAKCIDELVKLNIWGGTNLFLCNFAMHWFKNIDAWLMGLINNISSGSFALIAVPINGSLEEVKNTNDIITLFCKNEKSFYKNTANAGLSKIDLCNFLKPISKMRIADFPNCDNIKNTLTKAKNICNVKFFHTQVLKQKFKTPIEAIKSLKLSGNSFPETQYNAAEMLNFLRFYSIQSWNQINQKVNNNCQQLNVKQFKDVKSLNLKTLLSHLESVSSTPFSLSISYNVLFFGIQKLTESTKL